MHVHVMYVVCEGRGVPVCEGCVWSVHVICVVCKGRGAHVRGVCVECVCVHGMGVVCKGCVCVECVWSVCACARPHGVSSPHTVRPPSPAVPSTLHVHRLPHLGQADAPTGLAGFRAVVTAPGPTWMVMRREVPWGPSVQRHVAARHTPPWSCTASASLSPRVPEPPGVEAAGSGQRRGQAHSLHGRSPRQGDIWPNMSLSTFLLWPNLHPGQATEGTSAWRAGACRPQSPAS